MSDFSAEVKARADIAGIVGEFVALRHVSGRWVGLCPFHSEKTPSFHVHPSKQFFYCFGCQAHGDVFSFLMQLQKLSFPEAVATVAERLHMPLPGRWGGAEGGEERAALLAMHEQAAGFFQARLRSGEGAGARAYLAGRGVVEDAMARFQLGYGPAAGRALAQFLRSKGCSPALALASGLCQWRRQSGAEASSPGSSLQMPRAERAYIADDRSRAAATNGSVPEKSGPAAVPAWDDLYDRFRDRVLFPIANESGKIVAFGGRLLASDPNRPAPKYLNSPETPLYTKGRALFNLSRAREAIRRLGYFVLVEGYFDCLSVFLAGQENVVASCGTALTAAQIATLVRYARNVVVNFDPDSAGAAAVEKSVGLLLEEGCNIRVLTLPQGLDPDQFVRRDGAAGYAAALQSSPSYFPYLAERARRAFDMRRAEGRVGVLNFLLPYLGRVHDPLLRAELSDELAAQLGMTDPVERQQLRQAARQRRASVTIAPTRPPDCLPAESLLLRALVEWDEARPRLLSLLQEEALLEGLSSEPAVAQMRQVATTWDFSQWAAQLSPADRRLWAEAVLGRGEPLEEAAVTGAVEALRERRLEGRGRQLKMQVQDAERSKNWQKLKQLLDELKNLEQDLNRRRQAFTLRRGQLAGGSAAGVAAAAAAGRR